MLRLISSEYGIVGNPLSAALISPLGSVERLSLPYLDSQSQFASYQNPRTGGLLQLFPAEDFRAKLRYIPGTLVLETLFETPFGRATMTDWMPWSQPHSFEPVFCRQLLCTEGKVTWLQTCHPVFKSTPGSAHAERHARGVLFRGNDPDEIGILVSDGPLEIAATGANAISRFSIKEGEKFLVQWSCGRMGILSLTRPSKDLSLQSTLGMWQKYSHHCPPGGCPFGGPWHDLIAQTGLLFKLLQTPYSGSLALEEPPSSEAPTPSLNPLLSSVRHGAWILQALVNLNRVEEAEAYFAWVTEIVLRNGVETLQPFYTLDGSSYLGTPDTFSSKQLLSFQLDIYGHLILTAHQYFKIFGNLPADLWPLLSEIADYVCQAWRRPDHGPDSSPGKPEHFVASKVFCWAALEHCSQLAYEYGQKVQPRWTHEAKVLHHTICNQGFDSIRYSFVRSFGDREIDATCLWLPILGFLPPDDPRIQGTLDAARSLLSEGVLLRKSIDNEEPDLFSSFVFVTCLALTGHVEESSDRLAELCSYASPLGLFIGKGFPQTSVQLAFVNAALYVAWGRGKRKGISPLIGCTELPRRAKTA